ncbi:hypothetical protein [Pseudoalteromonas sp. BSi20429]|uniref:Orphan protein n=2 Tax=Bacteria TaxID=2 RepID=B4YPD0_9GAMM|nr:hypothetical protein [Pseudoalteromonas sp. BSi20429]ACF98431.1 hypothetical protein [Pseudoalteromonas sp. Bsi429]GAA69938.1 hypothetical protein P20429_4089 [Pseudoalteromonas sp. BSi20429]
MKKYIFLTITLLLTFSLQAKNSESSLKYCLNIEKASEAIMKLRQAGYPLQKTMETHRRFFKGNDSFSSDVMEKLIFKAYQTPKYEYKKEEIINEFKNKNYLQCLIQTRE